MRTTDGYLALIEPQHSDKPRFVATVALSVDVLARFQAFLATIPLAFDLDDAIGAQLDAVGVRVGRSRQVPIPIPDLYFSFDDVIRGFDKGIWKGPYDTAVGISLLDDETYRRLLRAKIAANSWDGTVEGQQAILDVFFTDPDTVVTAIDDTGSAYPVGLGDPSLSALHPHMTILITRKIPSTLDLALLARGLVAAKPGGVGLDYVVTSLDETPVFGFDLTNDDIAGFDAGAWGVSPDYIATHAI